MVLSLICIPAPCYSSGLVLLRIYPCLWMIAASGGPKIWNVGIQNRKEKSNLQLVFGMYNSIIPHICNWLIYTVANIYTTLNLP
jgi:hypothetical protein